MADFTKDSVADMAAANPGLNMGTTGSMRETERSSDDVADQLDEQQTARQGQSHPQPQPARDQQEPEGGRR